MRAGSRVLPTGPRIAAHRFRNISYVSVLDSKIHNGELRVILARGCQAAKLPSHRLYPMARSPVVGTLCEIARLIGSQKAGSEGPTRKAKGGSEG